MKTRISENSRPPAGYALLLTLLFLAIVLTAFGSVMHWVSSSTLVTERNNLHVSAQAAAESATEDVMTTMMRDFTYGSLNPVSTYDALVPDTTDWPNQFAFSDTNGAANRTSVNIGAGYWAQLPSQFSGLYGYGQDCVIASTAKTIGERYDVSSTVSQAVWFGTIPLFQFAIFYNLDLEINPGASMTVNGRVHSNYNMWATGSSSSSPLNFGSTVDASGFVTNAPDPLDPQNYGHRSGNVLYSDTNSPVSNADSLTLPIGGTTNNNPVYVKAILDLPPASMAAPSAAAYSTNGQVYLYNEADLIISNSPSGVGDSSTNALTVFYQNPNRAMPLAVVTPDLQFTQTVSSNSYVASLVSATNMIPATTYVTNIVYYTSGKKKGQIQSITITPQTTYYPQVITNTVTNVMTSYVTVTNHYYSFVTNQTFYDYREGKNVQAVQVDVGLLNVWLTNSSATGGAQYQQLNTGGMTSKGHDINSIYVYNSVPDDNSNLPAVRMTDGAQLPPDGLTVATTMPIYVKGDYNVTTDGIHFSRTLGDTIYTVPAALLGDAITVLSGNWKDYYNASTPLSSRNPTDVCLNAATLEGIVPSDGNNYSGGVENFLRLLENWSGHTVAYNGSIVVMFPSQYATAPWSYGFYYTAPNRQWGFDVNFTKQGGLPPLTPQVRATIRGDYASK
ncbi:MAG TPA: hypothetical protein VFY06_00945 [Verrucomicrobiae bacterium]|nr:hypothetical protein [Verrucomicrobiae bacterium]